MQILLSFFLKNVKFYEFVINIYSEGKILQEKKGKVTWYRLIQI